MKTKIIVTIVLAILTGGYLLVSVQGCKREGASKTTAANEVYSCPMHPQVTSDKPGTCSICNMALVKKTAEPNAR